MPRFVVPISFSPSYQDKAARSGIRIQDLLDEKVFRMKVAAALEVQNAIAGGGGLITLPAIMAKLTTDELIEAFKEMTLIELSEFVKEFEEVFDVEAAAPVASLEPGRQRLQ